MKVVIAILLFVFAFANAKKELAFSNCPGKAILTIDSINDSLHNGPIKETSVITVKFTVNKSTSHLDPFHVDLNLLTFKKKLPFLGYVGMNWIIGKIGQGMRDTNVEYKGNSVFRLKCPFKDNYGSCMPPKGSHEEVIAMKPIVKNILKRMSWLSGMTNGWYKMQVDATTANGERAFCYNLEFQLALF